MGSVNRDCILPCVEICCILPLNSAVVRFQNVGSYVTSYLKVSRSISNNCVR